MAVEQGMIILDIEEAQAQTAKVDRAVTEFADSVTGFVNDTKELENLGKSISNVRVAVEDINRLMQEAVEIANNATLQMNQFAEDQKAISEVNIEL